MKIKKRKETLILTQVENAILSEAFEILTDIYQNCEGGGDMESFANEAKDNIESLLEDAEIEGGEPTEEIKVTITL